VRHWLVAPVLLPLAAALALVLLARNGAGVRRAVSVAATLANVAAAAWLIAESRGGDHHVYRLGDWPAPFGIVLVLDRLSALMVALTAVVALFSVLQAVQGADEESAHFHALLHFQLVGLNGAFLTGDLFNLFVFFEILLIASYCLLIHGATEPRLRAGIHYVVLNLVGSALFLVAVGTLYGLTGTLNMADLSGRVAGLAPADAGLVRAAALILLVVFALKAALVPLYFWLPRAYAAAAAPVAALFAIMTKVGVYAIVRIYTLVFGADAGVAAGVADAWLLPVALATAATGVVGALGSARLRPMQGYLLITSVGTMLAGLALFDAGGIAAGLYYLVHSTLTMAAMFLIADLVAGQRGAAGDRLVPARSVAQPGVLGGLFVAGAVGAAGIPPFAGFIGKALILRAAPLDTRGFWVWSVVLGASLVAIVALARAGSVLFWNTTPDAGEARAVPARRWVPAAGLLAAVVLLTLFAGPASDFTGAAAEQLLRPEGYVRAVLGGRG